MNRQRVNELFEHALDVAEPERTQWLLRECADDLSLRHQVERLLRADAKARDFMERPPQWVADTQNMVVMDASDAAPRRFGTYRVLRSIGTGGMGEVWLAERNDGAFEQRVAIKQVAYPTPGLLQRFRQERQILARFEHPGIARLIDGGIGVDATPYIVMEYVEGVAITDYVATRRLDLRARLRLFLHVCAAVQYAHQNLVVHRDIKPSNIFVTADGSVKLLDFGIAKVLDAADSSPPTQTSARLLTPDYAAPEQFTGGAITTATDIYALGVVLYEMLAASRPHRLAQRSGMAVGIGPTTDPPPPSSALGRGTTGSDVHHRALRGDVDRIVMKALARDPQCRYASAEALAGDIARYLDGLPVTARGDSPLYRAGKFVKRNRYALGAAILVFAVCVTATAISLHQSQRAQAQATLAKAHAQRADAARDFLVGFFAEASPDENQGQPFTARQLLQKGERHLDETATTNLAIRADLTGLIGRLYWEISDHEKAEALLGKTLAWNADARVPDDVKVRNLLAVASMKSDKRELDTALSYARSALAFARAGGESGTDQASDAERVIIGIMQRKGDATGAESELRRLLASDLTAFGPRHVNLADDWQLLGSSLDELGRYDESAAAFGKSIDIYAALPDQRTTETCSTYNDLGLMLLHKGDFGGAEKALRQSLDRCRAVFDPDNDNARITRSNLIRTVELQGRFDEALAQRREILVAALAKVAGSRPDAIAFQHNFMSGDYRELGRFDEAVDSARAALAVWKRIQGGNDESDSATPMTNLAVALTLRGDYADAEAAFDKALAIHRRTSAPSSQWLNMARVEHANLLRLEGRFDAALTEASAAARDVQRSREQPNSWLAVMDAQVAEAALDAGDPTRAETLASDALSAARHSLPSGNYRLAAPLYALARAKLALGRAADAEPLFREALAARGAPRAVDDPRVLEVKVGLAMALAALGRIEESRRLTTATSPLLARSRSPYASTLLTRLERRTGAMH